MLSKTARSYSSVFNSSVPQRPPDRAVSRSYGGRPLGPNSYHPSPPEWLVEPERETSAFASKTQMRMAELPLTAELDFLGAPEQMTLQYRSAPGSRGLTWPVPPPPRENHRMPGLDQFSDAEISLENDVLHSARKYAASFQSNSKRMPTTREQHQLGPGSYDVQKSSVTVNDPKRASYAFKSETNNSMFRDAKNEPPDAVQSIQSAILARHWTSKGLAFSTRERFPRARPKWKD